MCSAKNLSFGAADSNSALRLQFFMWVAQDVQVKHVKAYYSYISATILKSQIIYKSCTAGFGYPEAVCSLLGTKNANNETKRIEAEVQPYAARVFLTIKIVECIVPAFCGLFVGALADRYGRKPLLLASYLGESVCLLSL